MITSLGNGHFVIAKGPGHPDVPKFVFAGGLPRDGKIGAGRDVFLFLGPSLGMSNLFYFFFDKAWIPPSLELLGMPGGGRGATVPRLSKSDFIYFVLHLLCLLSVTVFSSDYLSILLATSF